MQLDSGDEPPSEPSIWVATTGILCWLTVSLTVFKLWGPPISAGLPHAAAVFAAIAILPLVLLFPLVLFIIALTIRIGATAVFWREGLRNLPNNFRVLILCVSPSQTPEIIPGLENAKSILTLPGLRNFVNLAGLQKERLFLKSFDWLAARQKFLAGFSNTKTGHVLAKLLGYQPRFLRWIDWILNETVFLVWAVIVFAPCWAYRIAIKSTIWFWWPLAFIGEDLRLAGKPDLLHWNLVGSLWAKTSILVACLSLAAFIFANAVLDGAFLEKNPLIAPIGYLLLIDWKLQPWQVCAISASAMSIVLIFWMNNTAGRLRIAKETGDNTLFEKGMRELGWMERFARIKFLFVLSFWIMVVGHALLYFNSQTCAVPLTDPVRQLAQAIYGNQMPKTLCTYSSLSTSL